MKKILFSTLLLVSVVVNLAAATFLVTRATAPRSEKSAASSTKVVSTERAATASIFAPPAATAAQGDDLKLTKEMLMAEGYSPKVVGMILTILVGEKPVYRQMKRALDEEWKKRGVVRTWSPAEEKISAELHRKNNELNSQVLGEVSRLMPSLPAVNSGDTLARQYAARYGDLPVQTAEKLRALESENRETTDQQFAVLLKDILPPEQIDDYLRYNSMLARTIQFTLASIDVDEATYAALLTAGIEREQSATPNVSPMDLVKRNLQPSSVETYRRILGDDQFLKIIDRFDSVSASADAVYQVAGLTPAVRADLFMEAHKVRFQQWTAPIANERVPELARRTYQSLLQKAQLTPEQKEGFDRMLGAYLKRGELGPWGWSGPSRAW